jgi:uncharacterized protein DUF6885
MAGVAVTVIPGLDRIAALHAKSMPQKDYLCGCFWAAVVLRAAGVEVDQDAVAAESGTILREGDPATFVPRGATSRQDYRLPLPATSDPSKGGTAAPALARAIERLADGRLTVVPVAGPWSADTVVELVEAAAEAAPGATLLANIRTGPLWGTRPHPSVVLDYLAGRDVDPEPPEWDVGHFVNVVAVLRGPAAAALVVRDSYATLGVDGYHVQPAEAFARALERGDALEGGVLCVCPSGEADALRESLATRAYDLRHWDNGTPDPGAFGA